MPFLCPGDTPYTLKKEHQANHKFRVTIEIHMKNDLIYKRVNRTLSFCRFKFVSLFYIAYDLNYPPAEKREADLSAPVVSGHLRQHNVDDGTGCGIPFHKRRNQHRGDLCSDMALFFHRAYSHDPLALLSRFLPPQIDSKVKKTVFLFPSFSDDPFHDDNESFLSLGILY